jgi:hypothetical protein
MNTSARIPWEIENRAKVAGHIFFYVIDGFPYHSRLTHPTFERVALCWELFTSCSISCRKNVAREIVPHKRGRLMYSLRYSSCTRVPTLGIRRRSMHGITSGGNRPPRHTYPNFNLIISFPTISDLQLQVGLEPLLQSEPV